MRFESAIISEAGLPRKSVLPGAETGGPRKSIVPVWRPVQEVYDDAKVVLERQKTVHDLASKTQDLDLQGRLRRRHRCSRIQEALESSKLQVVMGLVISLNCILVVLDVQRMLEHSIVTDVLEAIIAGAFLTEWCMQVCVHGARWFLSAQHIMNTLLVLNSILTAGLSAINTESNNYNRTWPERLLRVFRLVWVLRMFHVVKAHKDTAVFSELWLLLYGLQTSSQTLISALVLIAITLYIFGTAAVYQIGEAEYTNPSAAALEAQQQFDNLAVAMLTLVRFMNADNAQDILDALMEQQPLIWMFTWLFTALTAFVLFNLVTAVIVQQALKSTQDDAEQQAYQRAKEEMVTMKELEQLFLSLDSDRSGSVTPTEFDQLFSRAGMREKLAMLGIPGGDPKELFQLVDVVQDGVLETEEFIKGMRAVRGPASSKDLLVLTKQLERLCPEVERLQDKEANKATQDLSSDEIVQRTKELETQVNSQCDALEARLGKITGGLKEVVALSERLTNARRAEQEAARPAGQGSRSRSKRGSGHAEERRKEREKQREHRRRDQEHRHREKKTRDREEALKEEQRREARLRQQLEERQEQAARRADRRYHEAAREDEPGTIVWARRRRRHGGGRADEFRAALEEVQAEHHHSDERRERHHHHHHHHRHHHHHVKDKE